MGRRPFHWIRSNKSASQILAATVVVSKLRLTRITASGEGYRVMSNPSIENSIFQVPAAAEMEAEAAMRKLVTPARIEARLRKMLGPGCDISGTDSGDTIFSSVSDLWDKEFKRKKGAADLDSASKEKMPDWYQKGYDYWESEENCPVSDDGVLGGFGCLTAVDTRDSNVFLDELLREHRPELVFNKAADCGAGIGRVSKNLLLPRCAHVDLVEQSPRLLRASAAYLGPDASRTSLLNIGLQDFKPAPNTYDLIWIQWVIGHLDDLDFVQFFRRCVAGLTEHGVIVLKDNCSEEWTFTVDSADSSVARSREYMDVLFDMAECEIVHESSQTDFPAELCAVHMFSLAPKRR